MTRIGVIARNTYVLAIYAPGSRIKIRRSFESRRPWRAPSIGEVLSIGRERLRVVSIRKSIHRNGRAIVHRIDVMTTVARMKRRARRRAPEPPRAKVIAMPLGDGSVVADFLRCHVLVRVFGGDPEAWLEALRQRSPDDDVSGADIRFIRWIRARLRYDPLLIAAIRRMVDALPLWNRASG
jgi:hypothetical protein